MAIFLFGARYGATAERQIQNRIFLVNTITSLKNDSVVDLDAVFAVSYRTRLSLQRTKRYTQFRYINDKFSLRKPKKLQGQVTKYIYCQVNECWQRCLQVFFEGR